MKAEMQRLSVCSAELLTSRWYDARHVALNRLKRHRHEITSTNIKLQLMTIESFPETQH